MNKPIKNIPDPKRQRGYLGDYSKWHWKNLPKWCYMIDLDSVEIRAQKGVVALVETRRTGTPLNELQNRVILSMASKLNVPAYLVFHDRDLTEFKVTDLKTGNEMLMTEDQYKEFLQKF